MTPTHNNSAQTSTSTSSEPNNLSISREFDLYSDVYTDAVNESLAFSGLTVDFFTKVKAAYFIDVLNRQFDDPAELSLLDIGCGVGIYHGLIGPEIKSLTGVDISATSIAHAREKHPDVDYHVYDGSTLPFKDNSFDATLTVCVMHHVPPKAWPNFAKEMARVLRPNGLAVVFEHNPRNPVTMRAVNNCPFDKDAVLLKATKMKELLSGVGLADVRSRYILSIPAVGSALRRIDGIFSPLGLGAQYYTIGRKSCV